MHKTWLSGLLRARQAQEDLAKQHLAGAERAARRAAAQAQHDRTRLEGMRLDEDSAYSASAFVAAAVALQAAAATHAAAVSASERCFEGVDERRDQLGDAARARRTAEEMIERVRAEAALAAHRSGLRDMDEIAARVHRDEAGRS